MKSRRKFIQQTSLGLFSLGTLPLLTQCKSKVPTYEELPNFTRVSPASQGVDTSSIFKFIEAAETSGLEWHSYMLLRNGKIVAEGWWTPFGPSHKHTLYSLSKSFTGTAVGIAISEGLLSLDSPVVSFFPEISTAERDDFLSSVTVKHLLTMTTGHDTDTFPAIIGAIDQPWLPTFFSEKVVYKPGSHFEYNTGASFVLSAIVQKVTGEKLVDYLKPRLFDPLGITDFDWEESPEGINAGGFGLRVNTEGIARFGQLYLQQGLWDGKQVIPRDWVRAASIRQVPSNPGSGQWSQGYGYQFWQCKGSGIYRGDGAYGQFCIVMPEENAVLAVTSESNDMGKSMDLIFEYLLPALEEDPMEETTNWENLKNLNARLSLPTGTNFHTTVAIEIANKWYKVNDNPFGIVKMQWQFRDGDCIWICVSEDGSENRLMAGMEKWTISPEETKNLFPIPYRTEVASLIGSTAFWQQRNRLVINSKFVQGIHGDQYTIEFRGREVQIFFINSLAMIDNNARNAERRLSVTAVRV